MPGSLPSSVRDGGGFVGKLDFGVETRCTMRAGGRSRVITAFRCEATLIQNGAARRRWQYLWRDSNTWNNGLLLAMIPSLHFRPSICGR